MPLSTESTIALIYPATRPSIREACRIYYNQINFVGVSEYPGDEEIAGARATANRADVSIVFTLNADSNARQQALVNALLPESTVVAALWSPYDRLSFPNISAYLVTYSPLPPAIDSACAILFGAVEPKGHLPVSLGERFP